jgi:curli production assembly/transport component CsgE
MPAASRFLMSCALSLASFLPASAQPERADPGVQADATGIVTNRAITVAGHDFFNCFIAAWRDKPDSERYALAIHERPSARLGSEIRIDFARRPLFQSRLPPSRAALKALAEEAVEITYQAVQAADAHRVLADDADLARDEF